MNDDRIETVQRRLQCVIPTYYDYVFMPILTNKIIYYEHFLTLETLIYVTKCVSLCKNMNNIM